MTNHHILEADLLRHQETGDLAAQAEALIALAESVEDQEAYGLAQGLYGQAWAIYDQIGDQRGIARVILLIIPILHRVFWDGGLAEWGLVDAAYLYDMVLMIYIELGDELETARIYARMARSMFYPVETAISFLEQALALYIKLKDVSGQLSMHLELFRKRDFNTPPYWEAVDSALRIYRTLDDPVVELRLLRRVYYDQFDSPEVQPYIERAVSLYRQLEDARQEAQIYGSMSAFYEAKHDRGTAAWALDMTRRVFMRAIIASCTDPERQAELYWQWGLMEDRTLQHTHMGYMLCQRAVTLFDWCLPGQNRYHKQLRSLRRQMNPSQYKWPKK